MVEIIPYEDRHQQAWYDLNKAWISTNFEMEAADYKSLRDPRGYILDREGAILIAEENGRAVGTCALIKMDDPRFDYELAKMCVAPSVRGQGVGHQLGKATLFLAQELGATSVYLETNKKLGPALRLYQKLGFQSIEGVVSPYARCDVQMAIFFPSP